jgi:hypothetical protein
MEKYVIDTNVSFEELSKATIFESVTKGRQGAVIVDKSTNEFIPIVRTTTIYKRKCQQFLQMHSDIINKIRSATNINLEFNNALVEIYDQQYKTMGFHSDQAQDLQENSYICIFSCYDASTKGLRKLVIKEKTDASKETIINMDHNSVILFSTETNKKYLHKIILDTDTNTESYIDNKWLGITFRLSKTFIYFVDEASYFKPYFRHNNKQLTIANNEEKKEFYKYRSLENKEIDFTWPDLTYTLSL